MRTSYTSTILVNRVHIFVRVDIRMRILRMKLLNTYSVYEVEEDSDIIFFPFKIFPPIYYEFMLFARYVFVYLCNTKSTQKL